MTNALRRSLTLAGISMCAAPWQPLRAQSGPYPNRTVRLFVGAPPGGLTDGYARLYAEQFTQRFGQPCVVENRPGASGIIATEAMVKSPPDGYTLLMTTTSMIWQNRVLYRKLPFDLATDIAPITIYPSGPLIVAVPERLGVSNFNELVDHARKTQCIAGSYSVASYPQLLARTMNRDFGCRFDTVQYKGEAPMWLEMATGQLDMAVGSFQAFNTVAEKGVRPIAVAGPIRTPKLPNLLTLTEQGLRSPVARLEGGLALSANAKVPDEIIELLARVAVEGNDTPRARALRDSYAIPDVTQGRADALRLTRELAPLWIQEVDALGIKLD